MTAPLIERGRCNAAPGYLPGFSQSVLLAELGVTDAALAEDRLAALDEALRPLLAAPATALPLRTADAEQHVVERIAQVVTALLRDAELPLFDAPAVVARHAAHGRFTIAVPIIDRAQRAAERALGWVVRWVNADAADAAAAGVLRTELPALREQVQRAAPRGMNTAFFLQAAHEVGMPWRRVVGNMFQFGWGARSRWFDSAFTEQTSNISTRLARDKSATLTVLRQAGLPVPAHGRVEDADAAERLAQRLGFPVVVKPADLDGGRGVAAGLATPQAVRAAFERARALSANVLVEKHIAGNDYRLHVFQGQVIFALHRVPGGVTGDGVATVDTLLARLNAEPLRGEADSRALLKRIALDEEALELLREQELTPDGVPAAGAFVRLRRTANVASGGMPVPILEEAHPDNLALAVRAARILRLDLAGIDLLMPDIRRSWLQSGAAICEVNAQPQLWSTLPAQILRALVPGDGRIPVVLAFGDDSQQSWLDALAERLAQRGMRVGLATPEAVSIGGRVVGRLHTDAYGRAMALLADPEVDVALLRVANDSLLATGLPVDRFDVLVLAGPPEDHAGAQAWRQARAFARAVRKMCRGPVIVNADCAPWVAAAENLREPRRAVWSELAEADLADGVAAAVLAAAAS